MTEFALWIRTGATLVSAIAAVATLVFVLRFRSDLTSADQARNLEVLFVDAYLERKLQSPVTVDGKEVYTLKELRAYANADFNRHQADFTSATLDTSKWQNRFAYEISVALQQVGVAALAGAIPLNYVLGMYAQKIVEDWRYAKVLVEELRKKERSPTPKDSSAKNKVFFHRRHAEWLACLAEIWLFEKWENGHTAGGDIEKLKAMVRLIGKVDKSLMPDIARRSVARIVGD